MIIENRSDNPSPSEADPIEDGVIQERAYLLWEAEGRQDGGADAYWHRARQLIEAETRSAYPPTQSRSHRS